MTLFVPKADYTPEQVAQFYGDPRVRLVVQTRALDPKETWLVTYNPIHEHHVGRMSRQ